MINRINLILQAKNITARQFAEEIGIQPSGMSHILSGRNNPSLDFVMKVIHRYPEIDTDWLLFGKGEMYTSFSEHSQMDSNVVDTFFKNGENSSSEEQNNMPDLFSGIDNEPPLNSNLTETSISTSQNDSLSMEGSTVSDVSESSGIDTYAALKNQPDISVNMPRIEEHCGNKKLVKIVFFYDDHSFLEYHPE